MRVLREADTSETPPISKSSTSGPRPLRTNAINIEARSHYRIVPFGSTWSIVVHRTGLPTEIIEATSRAEAMRIGRTFADAGLIGIVAEVPS